MIDSLRVLHVRAAVIMKVVYSVEISIVERVANATCEFCTKICHCHILLQGFGDVELRLWRT